MQELAKYFISPDQVHENAETAELPALPPFAVYLETHYQELQSLISQHGLDGNPTIMKIREMRTNIVRYWMDQTKITSSTPGYFQHDNTKRPHRAYGVDIITDTETTKARGGFVFHEGKVKPRLEIMSAWHPEGAENKDTMRIFSIDLIGSMFTLDRTNYDPQLHEGKEKERYTFDL